MTLGRTILRLRQSRDWTQGQLSLYSGIDQSYLSRLERDLHENVSIKVAVALANAFNISVDSLLIQAELLEPPDPDTIWQPELIIMQRILAQLTPEQRDAAAELIIKQAHTWLKITGQEPEEPNKT